MIQLLYIITYSLEKDFKNQCLLLLISFYIFQNALLLSLLETMSVWCLYVNFEQISRIVLVVSLLTLNK